MDYLGVQRSFRGSLGLPGSPGKFGSPWESAIKAVVPVKGLVIPLQQNTFCEHFPIYLLIQKLIDCQGEEALLKLLEPI